MAREGSCSFAAATRLLFATEARGPVVDNDVNTLAGQSTTDKELVAGECVGRTFDVETSTDGSVDLKLVAVVKQTHVDTTAVGAVEVYDVVVARCQFVGFDKVLEDLTIFILAHAYHSRSIGAELVGAELANGVSHVLELVGILERSPTIVAGGQELLVVGVGVVDGVEKILEVVESNRIYRNLILLGKCQCCK